MVAGLWWAFGAARAAWAADVGVEVVGVGDGAGTVIARLYREDGWLSPAEAVQTASAPAAPGRVSLRFEGVPAGVYGIGVFHDADGNGALDMRWLPYPRPLEGVGASRDPKPLMGPPSWDSAWFEVGEGSTTLTVTLSY